VFGEQEEQAPGQAQNIVLAARGFATDDVRQIHGNLSLVSNS